MRESERQRIMIVETNQTMTLTQLSRRRSFVRSFVRVSCRLRRRSIARRGAEARTPDRRIDQRSPRYRPIHLSLSVVLFRCCLFVRLSFECIHCISCLCVMTCGSSSLIGSYFLHVSSFSQLLSKRRCCRI